MEIAQTIKLPLDLKTEAVKKIMSVLGDSCAHPQSLFVGGCVRNALIHQPIQDIDIATQYIPDSVVKKLEDNHIKVIPTGIKHGTVTAVIEGTSFEITTLRRDEETDGRHAEVSFTDNWTEDARRRDFTMNALFADMEGNIYDPTGRGITDLMKGRVLFVGKPEQRIAEDYLRILRFFRFHAYYGQGEMDIEALRACQKASEHMSSLSRERITQEFLKILESEKVEDILSVMFDHKVLSELQDKKYDPQILINLVSLQQKYAENNVITRLFVLAGCQAKLFDEYLRLSHAQQNFLIKLDMIMTSVIYDDKKSLKRAIYYHGNDLLVQGYLLAIALNKVEGNDQVLAMIKEWQAPKFPLSGQDLMEEGYQTGPELGMELKRREEEWLDEVI